MGPMFFSVKEAYGQTSTLQRREIERQGKSKMEREMEAEIQRRKTEQLNNPLTAGIIRPATGLRFGAGGGL